MTDRPGMLDVRRRGGGTLPGMAPPRGESPKAASAEEPTVADAGRRSTAKQATPFEPTQAASPQPGRRTRRTAGGPSPVNRLEFGGAQKITVTTRTYRCIFDAYGELAIELSREGRGRVFQNDVLNAVLATCLPQDVAAARGRLDEYRAMLDANPPRDLRIVS